MSKEVMTTVTKNTMHSDQLEMWVKWEVGEWARQGLETLIEKHNEISTVVKGVSELSELLGELTGDESGMPLIYHTCGYIMLSRMINHEISELAQEPEHDTDG